MTKQKTTKKSLLASVLSLVLCMAMLIGTTFAWFTDSVTSGNNIIKSGDLDVNLYYWDNSMATGTNVSIQEQPDTKLFKNVNGEDILWEPGATGFGQFEVANEGSLALKYQLKLNFYNATETTPGSGKTLADVLSVYAMARIKDNEGMADPYLNELVTQYGDSMIPGYEQQSLKDFVLEGYLLPGESFRYELGVCWEPSANDNDYNVTGGLSIDFGVTLLATQYTYENDSFDDQYDKDARYDGEIGTQAELAAALAKGGKYKLVKNITTEEIEIPAETTAVLNLNGKTLTGAEYTTSSGATSRNNVVNNYGKLTIIGEGTIRTRNLKNNVGANLVIDGDINIIGGVASGGSAIWNEGDCTINNATITQTNDWNYAVQNVADNATMLINNAKVSANHGAISNTGANTSVVISGGSFECLASGHTVYATDGNVTIHGGTFMHSQQQATAEGNCVVYATGTVVIDGGTFDSVNAAFAYKAHSVNISVCGGVFMNSAKQVYSDGSLNDFVADGYAVVEHADGSVTVSQPSIPVWDGSVVETLTKSDDGKYHITTGSELAYLNTILNGMDESSGIEVVLDADIDLGNKDWTPIGYLDICAFNGQFDGNGHTIKNVKVVASKTDGDKNHNAGLFGVVKCSFTDIFDLTVENITISGESERVGGIVGMMNGGTIKNCHVINADLKIGEKVGGIVGDLVGVEMANCTVKDSTLVSEKYAGALTARTREDGSRVSVSNCSATNCAVTGADGYVGELVGYQIVPVSLDNSTATNVNVIEK